MSVQSESTTWFDEMDLDPDAAWLRMGTRQLGSRPWLVVDEHRDVELAMKQQLFTDRHSEVFAAQADAEQAGAEVLALVVDGLASLGVAHEPVRSGIHPLEAAGRLVQEDLCLMRRDDVGWVLAAASLSFPSRWRLADKLGLPLTEVHRPVDGYDPGLASRVDSLFDRLDSRIVWRRNWFIHPDDNLFQPDRPTGGDPTVAAEDCQQKLVIRSERQTLRSLESSGWILFTVRIQQSSLGRFLEDPDRFERFRRFVDGASADHASHRGLSAAQMDVLRSVVAGR